MGAAEFLAIFLLLVFSGPVALVVCGAVGALLEEARNDGGTICTPSRRANITASQPQPRRRMVQPVPPPFTFDTRRGRVPAQTHVSITPAPAPQRPRRAVPEVVPMAAPVVVPMAAPDLAPIAVEDWPTRQTVEPEVVTVNWTAARFGSLEIKRD